MKTLYIDLDDTLCDYLGAYNKAKKENPEVEFPQSVEGFWVSLTPIQGAIEAVEELSKHFDIYLLSAPSTHNPISYSEKRLWVEKHFGFAFCDRLILSCHKNLLKGDYLIDDYSEGKGQENFEGELILFGSSEYPDWESVLEFFLPNGSSGSEKKSGLNYRIFKEPITNYSLREAYYDENGKVEAFTDPIEIGSSPEDLIGHLELQLSDAKKWKEKIITIDDFTDKEKALHDLNSYIAETFSYDIFKQILKSNDYMELTSIDEESDTPKIHSLLHDYISFLSQKYWAVGWMNGIEFELWNELMNDKIERYKSIELLTLQNLSIICDGWMTYDNGFIPMDQWLKIYNNWKEKKK